MHWTNIKTENLFLISEYLSEVELYYSTEYKPGTVIITGDEYKHLFKVMRHNINDHIWITNGKGEIFKTIIRDIKKDSAESEIVEELRYTDELKYITLCIPYLKNVSRLEFAVEKCTELGVTSFIIYSSERTLTKNPKLDRWNKIALAAMKQSLRSFLPVITFHSLKDIADKKGEKIMFDQNAKLSFSGSLVNKGNENYLIVGPEGGFSEKELNMFASNPKYKLTPNRLRSETAAVTAVSRLFD
jgi:16S rRNA (uracil1498-N3)-methyltransferase